MNHFQFLFSFALKNEIAWAMVDSVSGDLDNFMYLAVADSYNFMYLVNVHQGQGWVR